MFIDSHSTPKVVVVGLDHQIGLQVARIFHEHRVPVIGIARRPGHFACRTRACEKIVFADIHGEPLIECLITIGRELEQKAVLIPCRDLSVLLISRNREALEPYYRIALPRAEVLEMLMDKLSFYSYALDEKLPIPQTFMLHGRDDAERAALSLNYPAGLKPPVKTATWMERTKVKAFKARDKDHFLQLYDRCSGWSDVLIAQDWIIGPDHNLHSCNCYFDKDSEPLVSFTARKLRQWPPETGETSLGEATRNEEVEGEALRLFKDVKLIGLGYIEFKKDDRDGRYYIVEPNIGRPTGRSPLAEACGVEMLYSMYCDLVGIPLPAVNRQALLGVKWINIATDLTSAFAYWRRGELTLSEWLESLRGKKAYSIFSLRDPIPFLAMVPWALGFTREK